MVKSDYRKIGVRLLILCALIMGLSILSRRPGSAMLASVEAEQAPSLIITPQQNVPLRIVSATVNTQDPLAPQVKVVVENATDKPIASYAIKRVGVTDRAQSIATTLVSKTSFGEAINPSQSDTETFSNSYAESLKTLALSVDFVEFTDGSTWGADSANSAERLRGSRFALETMKSSLSKKLKAEGESAIKSFINETDNSSAPLAPKGHTPEWEDGFNTSTGVLRKRLERAYARGGLSQVESELNKTESLQSKGGGK